MWRARLPLGSDEHDDMSVAVPQAAVPQPRLRWYQYSLRSLLIVVTLFAILCSLLAAAIPEWKRQRHQREVLNTTA